MVDQVLRRWSWYIPRGVLILFPSGKDNMVMYNPLPFDDNEEIALIVNENSESTSTKSTL
jgi:hypothetical protein